ncbi:MAG: ABC transporter ATP-binding protein [Candidatus Pacebacteria bacterium]|nr:ABC transporter ATP-binding protein [Candidatus Paceibacterota bacterium]
MTKSSNESETLIELKNVSVTYGGVKALDSVNVHFKEGEVVALMGPNGAGKSTILKAIFGLAPIVSSEHHENLEKSLENLNRKNNGNTDSGVYWRQNKISEELRQPHHMVPMGITLVPQGKRVFGNLTVKENLEIGGITLKDKSVLKERVEEVLGLFPALRSKLKQKSRELSGGQQQMVAIARGLITDPRILLLDEPSLGLAPKVVQEVFEKIHEINQKKGMAIVVVEHNLKSLLPIVDRAYVLDKGKVVAEGKGQDIVDSGIFKKVFLGALE